MTELLLDDLRAGDRVVVATRSSTYRLDVVDCARYLVRVSGGSIGEPRTALLVGRAAGGSGGPRRIRAGEPLVYTYVDRARPTALLRAETSAVAGMEIVRGPRGG